VPSVARRSASSSIVRVSSSWRSLALDRRVGRAQLVLGVATARDLGFLIGEQAAQLANIARDHDDAVQRAFVVDHRRARDGDRDPFAFAPDQP
jgi:hypothetical protein